MPQLISFLKMCWRDTVKQHTSRKPGILQQVNVLADPVKNSHKFAKQNHVKTPAISPKYIIFIHISTNTVIYCNFY